VLHVKIESRLKFGPLLAWPSERSAMTRGWIELARVNPTFTRASQRRGSFTTPPIATMVKWSHLINADGRDRRGRVDDEHSARESLPSLMSEALRGALERKSA
jgi:hypothetical protein